MTYDGKALAKARQAIRERKINNESMLLRRREEVFARVPELKLIEAEIIQLMTSVAIKALKRGEDAGQTVRSARGRVETLAARRKELLRSNGFPEDYLDEAYDCPKCRDTGYVMGEACSCLKSVYKAEAAKMLTSMLNLGEQGFERFDLSLYESDARAKMSRVYDNCKIYAESFDEESDNLLFVGGTGLGKTFLSASIAKVVSEKGFSVVYDSCVTIMGAFESQKFDRNRDNDESDSYVKRYLNCDLLILDDLGTEMTTAFTQSVLYTIINTRLINGKKTIISTNLTVDKESSDDELSRRYTPQVVSRLKGEYMLLQFAGRDIREVKKSMAN